MVEAEDRHERYFIHALARGFAVLAAFGPRDPVLTTRQIALRCRLPKPTVTRITYTLVQLGYLVALTGAPGRYALGVRARALGSTLQSPLALRAATRNAMQSLADDARAAVSLAVCDGLSMVYVEVHRALGMTGLSLPVGARIPVVRSAIGRAYLGSATDAECAAMSALAAQRGADTVATLQAAIARSRTDYARLGYAMSLGEWRADVNGIALALRDARTGALLAINCGGAASHLPSGFLLDDVLPRLRQLVQTLQHS